MKHTQLTLLINNFKTHKIMNKTVKTILQIASYIISALLGAYGGSALM